jgi:hemerythrin
MPFMTWTEKYGVERTMDAEHQKFFAIINKLYDAMSEGRGRTVIENTVSELLSYTRTHFSHEEQMLNARGYPDLASHQALHRSFAAKVEEMKTKLVAGNGVLPTDMLDFLRDWLSKHILSVDTKYAAWLKAN